jgi:hypothetical protein
MGAVNASPSGLPAFIIVDDSVVFLKQFEIRVQGSASKGSSE